MRKTLIGVAIAALLSAPAFADTMPASQPSNTTARPANALTQEQVESRIAAAGFKQVKDLKFEHGIWHADARGGDETWVEVAVHPVTGKIFKEGKPSTLNQQEIEAKVTAAGYQKVHDVEFHDGLWKGKASKGKDADVELLVDPDDGSVIGEEQD